MEKRYAPYSKWFGTGFKRLRMASLLQPHLEGALDARAYAEREAHLCDAYELCARQFNALQLIAPVPDTVGYFFDRPFKVIHGGDIAESLYASIDDKEIRRVPGLIGSVNQFSNFDRPIRRSVAVSKQLRAVLAGSA